MNTTLPETTESFVALKLTGKLESEDYTKMIPELERRIEEHGKLSLYLELEDFKGWTPQALFQDAKFDVKHRNDFDRIAVVCESNVQETVTKLFAPFTSATVRYYTPQEKTTAHAWAKFGA